MADEVERLRTELHRSELEIARLERMMSDFASVVSHEFRTPLTVIQGFSELLAAGGLSPEEIREYALDIHAEALRLNRMTTQLLDLERMAAGKMPFAREPVSLNLIAEEVVDLVAPGAPRHRLHTELDPDLPELQGDREKLTQMLMNLVSNAIKFSPDGGGVTVGTRSGGDAVGLTVRDQGIGIPPESLESVFDRQVGVAGKPGRPDVGGTGLGLALCRQIAQLHGGVIWVESRPGAGSTFHVTLPLSAAPTPE